MGGGVDRGSIGGRSGRNQGMIERDKIDFERCLKKKKKEEEEKKNVLL